MKVAFRVDASNDIGLGHIIRCINLAELNKLNIYSTFICRDLPGNYINKLKNKWFQSWLLKKKLLNLKNFEKKNL